MRVRERDTLARSDGPWVPQIAQLLRANGCQIALLLRVIVELHRMRCTPVGTWTTKRGIWRGPGKDVSGLMCGEYTSLHVDSSSVDVSVCLLRDL